MLSSAIINRYIRRNIYLGTFLALLVMVSLSLFFQLVRELDDIGKGNYDFVLALEYVALRATGEVVELMPLAVLLGSIISLGMLAGNSEFIAMQASGVSLRRILVAVVQAALVLGVLNFLLADWIVPDTETSARSLRSQAKQNTTALQSGRGIWLKDDSRVVHIGVLLPNGYAREIEIFELGSEGRLELSLRAESAVPIEKGWQLLGVEQTRIDGESASTMTLERMWYQGSLSPEVLRVMMIEPRHMSSSDLRAYSNFIEENKLDAQAERLVLWQKYLAPITIITMCLLTVPFILGAQRQSNTGQRLMIGILIGLAYVVVDRLSSQLGVHIAINPVLIAVMPNLIFLALAVYLLFRKQSLSVAVLLGSRQT